MFFFFFFNDTATTEIYTLSLHDALPIFEWGDPRNRDVLVCVHGLTRSAQDFDSLARELCGQFRVVCPDVAGRGDSRSEEHTSELQSPCNLVCRLLLEKKKKHNHPTKSHS